MATHGVLTLTRQSIGKMPADSASCNAGFICLVYVHLETAPECVNNCNAVHVQVKLCLLMSCSFVRILDVMCTQKDQLRNLKFPLGKFVVCVSLFF